MKAKRKKSIIYTISFAYIVICSVILFVRPDIKIRNEILFYFIFILLFPGLFISFLFGFLGGTKWAIIGIILTVVLTIYIIERVFKRRIYHKINNKNSEGKKYLGIILFILAGAYSGYGQSVKPRVDINRVYESEVKRLLLPGNDLSTQTLVLTAFLVHPVLDPDYSICLKDSAQQSFLELRLLDKNLWYELLTSFMQKQSLTLPLKTSVYKAVVSKDFKRKMLKAFDLINPIKEDPFQLVLYDGITYEFVRKEDGKMKKVSIAYELATDSYESRFVQILDSISNNLKTNSFKESSYIDKLDLK